MSAQRQWRGWLCDGGGCAKVKTPTRPVPCPNCAGYKAAGR